MDWPLLALAIEDYAPVLLSGLGLLTLRRAVVSLDRRAGQLVAAGTTLIVGGGLTKPVYKTILAVTGGALDVSILDALLFWFLAPGFLLVASGLQAGFRTDQADGAEAYTWPVGAAVAAVMAGVGALLAFDGRLWFFVLLTIATIGNAWTIFVLMRWANARNERIAQWLFLANLVIVFALAGAASAFEQTIPVQWGEQLASTTAQGLFLVASIRLVGAVEGRSERVFSLP